MADRTVRAIFEARVSGAKKDITSFGKDVDATGKKVDGLTKDLKTLGAAKVKPKIDVEIDKAKKGLTDLTRELADLKSQPQSLEVDFKIEQTKAAIKDVRGLIKDLTSQKSEVRIDASIKDAQKRIAEVTQELGLLRTMEVTPQVSADIKAAQKKLRDTKTELRELNGAKAEVKVTADTSSLKGDLKSDMGDAGDAAGDEAGGNIATGILDALRTIPIAGAVVGVGAAIAFGILSALKDGLQVEAGRDLFSARTGLDEATSARFGRAAGEAYANAWGDSIEGNLDTARVALEQGLIDADSVDADVEQVIASLSGITDIMGADIPAAARAAGQLIKTGLVDGPREAFDVLVAGYQNGADASQDFLDTLIEYPTHFRDLGLSAQDATGLLIQGMDGGAFNADKVADSLKELTIKVKELDKTSAPALKALGLNAEKMSDAFNKGGPAARDALDQILTKLRAVKDPTDRAALAVGLFGTQAEDMGDALGTLNLDTAAAEIDGVAGAAGAAERALATMSDNAASKIESAKRNISVAADGIKGALAAAFEDEISGAADWVAKNRAPLMQFFLDVINGAIDVGLALAEMGAQGLVGIAEIAEGFASLAEAIDIIPGIDTSGAAESLRGLADSAREGADGIRENVPQALDDVRDKVNTWAAPELLKARIHDATAAMVGDMEVFSAKVAAAGGEIKINGDSKNAEQVLEVLKANINGEDGTVTINGDKVPAEDALDTVMALIDAGAGKVTIGGDSTNADSELSRLMSNVNRSSGAVDMGGNTKPGRSDLARLLSATNNSSGAIDINARTAAAERAINFAARDRFSTIRVNYADGGGVGGIHEGGIVTGQRVRGLQAGGVVPGPTPGYDNILWPLNMGGRTLQQPLEGGEMVVNAKATASNLGLLEFINAGGKLGGSSGSSVATIDPGAIRAMAREVATQTAREVSAALISNGRTTALASVSSRKVL